MEFLIHILSATLSVGVVTFIGYANGMEDANWNKPGFHEGGFWDLWHIWGRAFLYLGCVGWFAPVLYPWWWTFFLIPLAGGLNWCAFRTAVYRSGDWDRWYGNEKGLKGWFGRQLHPILVAHFKTI